MWPPALLGGRSLCVIQEKNDSTVVVGYAKGTVGVIDMKCDLVRYFSIHDYGESAMGIAAYGNDGCMLSVSGDNTIRRTSIATGVSCVQKLFRTGGTCLALDKEASHAFIGCRDGSVCVVHLNFDSDYGGDLVGHRREMFDHLECPGGVLWTRSGEGRCIEWRIKDGVSLSERIIERVALYSVISRDSHPPAQHDLGLSLPRIDSVRHEQRGSTVLLKQPGGQAAFCAQHIRVCSFDPLHFFWFEDNYVGFAVLEGCEGLDASGSLKGNQFASELRG